MNVDPATYLTAEPDRVWTIYKEHAISRLSRYVPHGSVLEVGYGSGRWIGEMINKAATVTLVDSDATLIDAARQRFGQRVSYTVSNFEEFTTEVRFDFISLALILEHVEDPGLFLTKAKDLLLPGGKVLILVPNAYSIDRQLEAKLGHTASIWSLNSVDALVGHRRLYSKETLLELVSNSPLAMEEIGGLGFKPLPADRLNLLTDKEISALARLGDELPCEMNSQIYAILRSAA